MGERAFNNLFDKMANMPLQRTAKIKPKPSQQQKLSWFARLKSTISPSQLDDGDQDGVVINKMMSSEYNKYTYDPYALPRGETSTASPSQGTDNNVRIIKGRKNKLKPLDFTPKLAVLSDNDGTNKETETDKKEYDEMLKSGREKLAQVMAKKDKKLTKKQKKKERAA